MRLSPDSEFVGSDASTFATIDSLHGPSSGGHDGHGQGGSSCWQRVWNRSLDNNPDCLPDEEMGIENKCKLITMPFPPRVFAA